jgi:hypothetical protein
MKLKFKDDKTGGELLLYKSEEGFLTGRISARTGSINTLPLHGTQGKPKQ